MAMHLDWIFEPLGIEKTKDKKRIKKAYAQKVKECHPEEHPKEWQQLHLAYKDALNYADGKYFFYDVPEDVEEQIEDLVMQTTEAVNVGSVLGGFSADKTDGDENSLFTNLLAQTEIINDSDICKIDHQLENLLELTDDVAHIAWINFFDSASFLKFYHEPSVIDKVGRALKEIQVSHHTATYIQKELEIVIRKLHILDSGYEADVLSAIKTDFRNRTQISNLGLEDIISKWEGLEEGGIAAKTVLQQLKVLSTLPVQSSYGAWVKFFESSLIWECYSNGQILEALSKVLEKTQISKGTAEYIKNMSDKLLERLENINKENEWNLVKNMQQKLQKKYELPTENTKQSTKQRNIILGRENRFAASFAFAFLGLLLWSHVIRDIITITLTLLVTWPIIYLLMFSVEFIVCMIRNIIKKGGVE